MSKPRKSLETSPVGYGSSGNSPPSGASDVGVLDSRVESAGTVIANKVRYAMQAAEKSEKSSVEFAVQAGEQIHLAKEWLKSNPLILQTWEQWFEKHCTHDNHKYTQRTASDYLNCYRQVTFDSSITYPSIRACLKEYKKRVGIKKRTTFSAKEQKPVSKIKPWQQVADQVRESLAAGETIPATLEDLADIAKAIRENAKQDRAAENEAWIRTSPNLPEEFAHEHAPKMLDRGILGVVLPHHLERVIQILDDKDLFAEQWIAIEQVQEVISVMMMAILEEIQDEEVKDHFDKILRTRRDQDATEKTG